MDAKGRGYFSSIALYNSKILFENRIENFEHLSMADEVTIILVYPNPQKREADLTLTYTFELS